MARLILDRVSKRFGPPGSALAVADVSLEIETGTFLALLGPSGCGKTTILRMLAGFETPTNGTIRLADRTLAAPDAFVPPEKRNMAMVFQSYALWPHMSVADNIGYPLKIRGIRGAEYKGRIGEALETVHMANFADRRPSELSGGQRQRVALARCLVSEPDVVLLDEPLANLDRHLRAAMEETFREFHARTRATMIYVTHDQSEAMALADRIAVMAAGRLLQLDQPEAIYRRPQSRAVADLIGHGFVLRLPLPETGSRDLGPEAMAEALGGRAGGRGVADVFVRPEDVAIASDGRLKLRVASCAFQGERYALTLTDGADVHVKAYAAHAVAVGEELRLSIRRGWRIAGSGPAAAPAGTSDFAADPSGLQLASQR